MLAAILFALVQAGSAPRPVTPPPATLTSDQLDARCLVALASLGNSAEPTLLRMGQFGVLFYYGKLLGRDPRLDLPLTLRGVSQQVIGPALDGELRRCSAEVQHAAQAMIVTGTAMAAPNPGTAPTPAPNKPGR